MSDPYALALSLGRPVATGALMHEGAHAHLVNTIATMPPDGRKPADILRIAVHVLDLAIYNAERAIEQTAGNIRRQTRRMIEHSLPSNMLLAEAHQLNADMGRAMTEPAVNSLVRSEMRRAVRYGN